MNKLSASDILQGVIKKDNGSDKISLNEIMLSLHERSFAILMMIFALPLSIPVPLPPGVTTVASIPLLLFSIQMILGFHGPWLPKWLGEKKIKRETLARIIEVGTRFLRKIERVLKRRLDHLSPKLLEKIVGFFAFIFSISIAIPLPLTNFIPAIGIVFMSLGLLSHDGIFKILGAIIGLIGVCITSAIIIFGLDIVLHFQQYYEKILDIIWIF